MALFILIWYVKLGFNYILPLTIVIKAILTACHSSVVTFLNQGYSDHQIQAKTNLGKVTVGRSAKEVENNKENNFGGHSSKLFTCNNASIIKEICLERVDNAVQAIWFIHSTISFFYSSNNQKFWRRVVFTLQQRRKSLCWTSFWVTQLLGKTELLKEFSHKLFSFQIWLYPINNMYVFCF